MAVLSLALGIGANVAIFSVAHSYLLRVWQVRSPEQLFFVRARAADGDRVDDFPWPIVERLRQPMRSIEGLAAFDGSTITAVIGGQPEILYADFVSGDYFPLLDVRMALGRRLEAQDDVPGRPAVGVISYAFWTQRFGADPDVVGKTVVVKDLVCTIVGVTGPSYFGRQTAGDAPALTLPMTWKGGLGLKDHVTLGLLGRFGSGSTLDAARAELDTRYQAGARGAGSLGRPVRALRRCSLAYRVGACDARRIRQRAVSRARCGFCSWWPASCSFWRRSTSPASNLRAVLDDSASSPRVLRSVPRART